MKRLAGEDLGYEKALKYFTPEEIKSTVEETIGRELQDSDIFSDLAEEKDAKSITVEDMIDFASDDFEFKDNFMYDLMAVAKFNDDENLANEAEDQSFDVIDIIDTVINKNADVKKKLEADLKVTYSMYLHNNSEAEGISDVKELSDNDDKVGDTISCSKDFDIDLGNRDSAFLYMRGEIIVGNKNETHSDLINKYFKNENVPRKRIRSVDSVDDLEAGEPIAFGHIVNNMAFIQTTENCSLDDVVKALKEADNELVKIYDYQFSKSQVKRLAKKRW